MPGDWHHFYYSELCHLDDNYIFLSCCRAFLLYLLARRRYSTAAASLSVSLTLCWLASLIVEQRVCVWLRPSVRCSAVVQSGPRSWGPLSLSGMKFRHKILRDFKLLCGEKQKSLSHLGSDRYQDVTDRQTPRENHHSLYTLFSKSYLRLLLASHTHT